MVKTVLLLSMALLLTSCGGGGGSSSSSSSTPVKTDFTNPVISGINITPLNLHFTGGNITVLATVTDDEEVGSVRVIVSGAASQNIPMTQVVDDYNVVVTLPKNENLTEIAAEYSLLIRATDKAGNSRDSASFNLTVKAIKRPPLPPLIP